MNNIRTLRRQSHLTMKQLGEIIGVAESTVSLYETEKREPDLTTLTKLARHFGVTIDYLLNVESDKQPSAKISIPNISTELLAQLDLLSPEQQEKVIVFIKGLLA